MPACTLRIAEPKDIEALAKLHVAVWRDTYRELAPPDAFAALDVPKRISFWRDKFAHPAVSQGIFIAEVGGELAGFSLASGSSNPEFGDMAEIKFLYVSPVFKRQGIGRRLIDIAATHLIAEGYRSAGLGVVEGNEPAIRFYRALGGLEAGRYNDAGPLWRSPNIIYSWPDISVLTL
ncbi:GNAT family N-acetyltransferase [Rahnella woolbedingensis]|uniref:GNAT family N-acetyltransferase n=1 Tax=Rahnella woolbedingensis TaxID=1510574 RepID=A0A419N5G6_9GAMM|nr:GNAT family N-acetyltransferase [Rahnella woolbedingensis]RJT41528.1 GNAT family N-acetyltransferase [Rahnella woolbedingensis]